MKTETFTCDCCGKVIEEFVVKIVILEVHGYYNGSPNRVYFEYHLHQKCTSPLRMQLKACPQDTAGYKYGRLYTKGMDL